MGALRSGRERTHGGLLKCECSSINSYVEAGKKEGSREKVRHGSKLDEGRPCNGLKECAGVCEGMRECARVCEGMRECARVCKIVRGCVRVCERVRGCAMVRESM